jgi:transposase, IS5 family
VICADQVDRARANRVFCQRHGIRLFGPRLGRRESNPQLPAEEEKQFRDDQRQRNAVEGNIGQGQRKYGLDLLPEALDATKESAIVLNVIVMNLDKIPGNLLIVLACWLSLHLACMAACDTYLEVLHDGPAAA